MTVRNVRVKALFDTLAETVLKAKAKTPLDTIESSDIMAEKLMNSLQTL